jgi:hypothetical protein
VNTDEELTDADTIVGSTGNQILPSRHQKPLTLFTPLEIGDSFYLPDSEGGPPSDMPVPPIRSGMFFWRVIGQ